MSDGPDLTGSWVGEYRQYHRPHPIRATFTQEGDRLTGAMRDVVTDSEASLFDITSEAGMVPGADETIDAMLRKLIPGAPSGPIRYVTRLPDASALSGSLRGHWVEFVKTYEGMSSGGYRVGDRFVEDHAIDGHSVHYAGRLSADGEEIEGRWRIDTEPGRVEGTFTLRREPVTAPGPTP